MYSSVRFFNVYVVSLSASIGWGGESGACQITLAEDPANGLLINLPDVGTPCKITFGSFTFGGIFQRWTKREQIDGFFYDIVLESPSRILDGVQVITDTFNGKSYPLNVSFTTEIGNVINPFAELENADYDGTFGGAYVSEAGMPATLILQKVADIINGNGTFGGPIEFGDSEYGIDLSQLSVPLNYRIKGPAQSLAAIIQDITEVGVFDYFLDISGDANTNGVIANPVIRVNVIDRKPQTQLGVVSALVEQYRNSGILVSNDNGQELSDTITQKIVIGGPASRYLELGPASIVPVWGKTSFTNPPQYALGTYADLGNPSAICLMFLDNDIPYYATVLEIRCALSSRETWEAYHAIFNPNSDVGQFANYRISQTSFADFMSDSIPATDFIGSDSDVATERAKFEDEQVDKLYNSVRAAGEQVYGKKWMVFLPVEYGGDPAQNIVFSQEDFKWITSWDLADSAYWFGTLPVADVSFYDSNGRLQKTAVWNAAPTVPYDYSDLGTGYSGYNGGTFGIASKDIQFEQQILPIPLSGGTIALGAVVDTPAVWAFDEYTTPNFGLASLLAIKYGESPLVIAEKLMASFGAEEMYFPMGPAAVAPLAINIPQTSNRYSWGPWWNFTQRNGKAEIEFDTTLSPENFPDYDTFNAAGFAIASAAAGNFNINETGYVELAEIPTFNLGARFSGSGPYVTSMDIRFDISRIVTTYKFNTWTRDFGKLAKYNIDRIQRINRNYIAFLQDQRNKYSRIPLKPIDINKPTIVPNRQSQDFGKGFSEIYGALLTETVSRSSPMVHGTQTKNAITALNSDYSNKYGASLDHILSPIATKATKGVSDETKPYTEAATASNGGAGLFFNSHMSPTSKELDPFFKFSDYDMKTVVGDSTLTEINRRKGTIPTTEVRTMGLRGPLILSGWGYDTVGLPVPGDGNGAFDPVNPAIDRRRWKTGPVDLRWDDERKVWAGGLEIVEGVVPNAIVRAASDGTPTTFDMHVYRKQSDGSLARMSSEKITVVNRDPNLGINPSGKKPIYASAMKINKEWRIIYISCPASGSGSFGTAFNY